MCSCANCHNKKKSLIYLPLYGYLCGPCYRDIVRDYLK